MSTVKFATFPFEYKGKKFVSKIAETNRFIPQIMLMGDAFISLNKQAIDECMTIDENSSDEYITSQLEIINAGGTEMFLELAGN